MEEGIDDIKLKDLYFGIADGLEESKCKNFESIFYKGNNKFKELEENNYKFIISGKKGTGKTILAKYFEIQQNSKKNFTKMLTDSDVVLREFIEFGKKDVMSNERDLFIEYTIYNELGKIILENKLHFYRVKNIISWIKINRKLRKLNNICIKRINTDNFVRNTYFKSENTLTTFTGKIKSKVDSNISAEKKVEGEYSKNPYYNQLDELRECVKYLLHFRAVNLIFDDLDEYDDIIEGNQKFIQFFNNFIRTTQKINSNIKNSREKYNSRVIIIIRSDMLIPLNESAKNLNKIISDCQVKLNWIKKSHGEEIHPLMDLIANKIKNSNKSLERFSNKQIIEKFFPNTVKGIELTSYMLNSSFGRPRDITNMLNTIKEENKNEPKIKAEMFIRSGRAYSEKFLNELRNEMALYMEREKINQCFAIIEKIDKREFWLSDIENIFQLNKDVITKFKDPKEFYTVCYNFGIIGNVWKKEKDKKNGNKNNKKNYSWKYREDGRGVPNEKEKFVLHFALSKALIHK